MYPQVAVHPRFCTMTTEDRSCVRHARSYSSDNIHIPDCSLQKRPFRNRFLRTVQVLPSSAVPPLQHGVWQSARNNPSPRRICLHRIFWGTIYSFCIYQLSSYIWSSRVKIPAVYFLQIKKPPVSQYCVSGGFGNLWINPAGKA